MAIAFTLNEATLNEAHQASIGGVLTAGTPSEGERFCALFGGAVTADWPATPASRGWFKAAGAPPSERCVLPP